MTKNNMKYSIGSISSIKGKKSTLENKDFASAANVSFRGSFLTSKYNEELGFNSDTENVIEFKIVCENKDLMALGSLIESIRDAQDDGKSVVLIFDASFPSYGDYKTVYSSTINITATEFLAKYKALIK